MTIRYYAADLEDLATSFDSRAAAAEIVAKNARRKNEYMHATGEKYAWARAAEILRATVIVPPGAEIDTSTLVKP